MMENCLSNGAMDWLILWSKTLYHLMNMTFQISVWLLFAQELDFANIKENIKTLHYWPFVGEPVDSPDKGLVM